MTLLQLRYFSALARNLHYTRTAEQFHISQPSLSYEISELEKGLGARLVSVQKRKVRLTEFGEAFLPFADRALAELETGEALVREMIGKQSREIRLGYFHSIAADFIPELVNGYAVSSENPDAEFRFTESRSTDLIRMVRNNELDLGITLSCSDDPALQFRKLFSRRLYLTVPAKHPLAKKDTVVFPDFCAEPQIVLKKGLSPRETVDRFFREAPFPVRPDIRFEVDDCSSAVQYVILGYGVAVLSEVPELNSRRIRAVPILENGEFLTQEVYLCRPAGRKLSGQAEAFYRYITEQTGA